MSERDVNAGAGSITFTLTSRLQISGEVALVLRLYRFDTLAATSTLMICDRQHLPDGIRVCRSHLAKLGVSERNAVSRHPRSATSTKAA